MVAWAGAGLAAAALAGLPDAGPAWVPVAVWLALWALYLSIVNVGQTFYGFGWETLLLEAGFLAVFLGPAATAPPILVLWLFRWLLFRVEFGAGLIKLRGDRCWRDLSCLDYHHETQPLPGPAELVLPPPATAPPQGRGAGQPRHPAGGAVRPVRPPAGGHRRRPRHHRHPDVAAGQRQLLLAQPDHHRAGHRRPRRPLPRRRPARRPAGHPGRPGRLAAGRRRRPDRAGRRPQRPAGPQPARPPPADERQLRPAAPGQHLRRLRRHHPGPPRGRPRGHRRPHPRPGHRLAGVRVQGQARRPPAAAPARSPPTTCGSTGWHGSRPCPRPRPTPGWSSW